MKVVKVLDPYNYVIDAGRNAGIAVDDKMVVYLDGEEIFDSEKGRSLGKLELPKTRCYVTHVQDMISIIKSDEAPDKTAYALTVASALRALGEGVPSRFSFLSESQRKVAVGDRVKQVSS